MSTIGVSCLLPYADLNPDLVLNAADAAVYRAKSDRRARYEVANQEAWKISNDTPLLINQRCWKILDNNSQNMP